MCTSPIWVSPKIDKSKECYDLPSDDILIKKFGYRHRFLVPCGKCLECLKKRQADLQARAVLEARKRGSMHFLTLTYDEDNLPLAVSIQKYDASTGELVNTSPIFDVFNPARSLKLHQWSTLMRQKRAGTAPRYLEIPFLENYIPFPEDTERLDVLDGYYYKYLVTPSLRRHDVKNWLKASRESYRAKFGFRLDFSYIVCGEYGPHTARPHYHCCLFGLNDEQANFFFDKWRKRFGVQGTCERVKCINKDGSDGFSACARYVSKYMTKGVFECQSVVDGHAQKPRLQCSINSRLCKDKNHGIGDGFLTPQLISYFRCEDLFGKYSLFDLTQWDNERVTLLRQELVKRSFIDFGSYKLTLPRKFIKKLWFYYDIDSKSYKATPLRKAISAISQGDALDVYIREFEQNNPGKSSREVEDYVCRYISLQGSFEKDSTSLREEFVRFYNKSIF